jgi:hypothetical protein
MVIVPFTKKRDLRGLKEPTLSGHTLQLTLKVKYLGLILDEGLTWKAQLKNVMSEADRDFCTCKGTLVTYEIAHSLDTYGNCSIRYP